MYLTDTLLLKTLCLCTTQANKIFNSQLIAVGKKRNIHPIFDRYYAILS